MEKTVKKPGSSSNAWACVKNARLQDRPQTRDYIRVLVSDFFETHGDRTLGEDAAMVTGIGRIDGRVFTIIGQQKGHTIEERKACNFGMPHPSGYRKSMRAIDLAEKFGRPILCLIDTPGAFCGVDAEQRGQGTVIAEHLSRIASVKVPVISVVIGEGGSGGALALAIGDALIMMENTYFSVISPEGCASILFKDSSKAEQAAQSLALTPKDLLRLGIADCLIKEEPDFAIDRMEPTISRLKMAVNDRLSDLAPLSEEALVKARYQKMLAMKGHQPQ